MVSNPFLSTKGPFLLSFQDEDYAGDVSNIKSVLNKITLRGSQRVKLKMIASSKPLLKEDIIQFPVLDKDISEATCSEASDRGSGVVAAL